MCYSIYMSTTSEEDFSKNECELFFLCPLENASDFESAKVLAHPNRWFLMCQYGGCSCHFRHDTGQIGFGPVLDWYPEDDDDVEATQAFCETYYTGFSEGYQVDFLGRLG